MPAHHHVTEEWKGMRPTTLASTALSTDAERVFDEIVRQLRDVIGLTPRNEGRTGTMRTQVLDSGTDGWVTIRTWRCEADACHPNYHTPIPPTDRADWYANALKGS
jgi:hypothetical protein